MLRVPPEGQIRNKQGTTPKVMGRMTICAVLIGLWTLLFNLLSGSFSLWRKDSFVFLFTAYLVYVLVTLLLLYKTVMPGRRRTIWEEKPMGTWADFSTKGLLEWFIEDAADAIALVDYRENRLVHVNPAFEKMFGWSAEEILDLEQLPNTVPTGMEEEAQRFFNEVRAGKHIVGAGTVRQRKDGSLIHVSMTISPIRDEQNHVVGSATITRDVTEKIVAQQALMESEAMLRTLMNSFPDAVNFKDVDGRWVEANEGALRLFNIDSTQYKGKTNMELLSAFHQAIGIHCNGLDEDVWSIRETVHMEESLPQPDGAVRVFDVRKVPVFLADGSRKGVVTIARDITEEKKNEELLLRSEKLSLTGQLAAGLAHEIRNPLTAVKGFIQLIRTSGSTKEEYFHIVESELSRIELIASQLLVLAKPQAINFGASDLVQLLRQTVTLLDSEAVMNNVEIALQFDTATMCVRCDANQLKQVFINLLKNAIEAMPGGGKIIIHVQGQPNQRVAVRIRDHGPGIPGHLASRLGEPFYSTKEKGTGLGVMVSRKIVEDHRGTIEFHSKQGEGTTVDVTLPLVQ